MTTKTAAAVLQELMVKNGEVPEYECVGQTGPNHQSVFEYRCIAQGVVVSASARSKKEAKQLVAGLMLQKLSEKGMAVPPPYGRAMPVHSAPRLTSPVQPSSCNPRSFVALLQEFGEQYKLPSVEYELIGDTGPPHARHFTVKARIGCHHRQATSTTKKAARQIAAEQLYRYLRENLSSITKDFEEEEALVRYREKAMDKYTELKKENAWTPDLSQTIAEYHTALKKNTDPEKRKLALEALENASNDDPLTKLESVAAVLELQIEYVPLGPIMVVQLSPATPEIALAGTSSEAAAKDALDYLHTMLN